MAIVIPVTYRPRNWRGNIAASGLPIALLGIALATAYFGLAPIRVLAILAGVLALVLFVVTVTFSAMIISDRRARRYVVDSGNGFRWIGGRSPLEIEDHDVVAVRLKYRRIYSQGILVAAVRGFEVWTDEATEPLQMTNRFHIKNGDPLESLIERLIENLRQRTADRLIAGGILEGEGWRLTASKLTVVDAKREQNIPLGQIDHVAYADGKLCLWIKGEPEPVRLDPGSMNVPVLESLLSDWVAHKEQTTPDAENIEADDSSDMDPSGMGRLLFERVSTDGFQAGVSIAVICGLVGFALLVFLDFADAGYIFLTVATAAFLLALAFGQYSFRCYERAVTERFGGRERTMHYEDILEFIYKATRRFVVNSHTGEPMYAGTSLVLYFRSESFDIRYVAEETKPDMELDTLRDRIAQVVGERMLREHDEGKSVPWGTDLVFHPSGLFVTGFAEAFPYADIDRVDMDQGEFFLYVRGVDGVLFSQPTSTSNFFPGLYVMCKLLERVKSVKPVVLPGS